MVTFTVSERVRKEVAVIANTKFGQLKEGDVLFVLWRDSSPVILYLSSLKVTGEAGFEVLTYYRFYSCHHSYSMDSFVETVSHCEVLDSMSPTQWDSFAEMFGNIWRLRRFEKRMAEVLGCDIRQGIWTSNKDS